MRSTGLSPGRAVGESKVGADVGDVDDGVGRRVLCGIQDELVGDFGLIGDVVAADFIRTQAQRAAWLRLSRALAPADRADAISVVQARRIAQSAAKLLVCVAGQLLAVLTTVGVLGAGGTNIRHSGGAVWRANAASNVVETGEALGEPMDSPFLAVRGAIVHLATATAISIRLEAVSTIVTEAFFLWAVLPADRADTSVASLARTVAESAIFLHSLRTGAQRLAYSATGSLSPARVSHISVVVVMVELVDGGAVVVGFGVAQGLLGVTREVRHVGLIFVVAVVALVRKGVVVHAVDAALMVGAVVEVLRLVVGVVVAVLHFVVVALVVHCQVLGLMTVVVQRQVMVVDVVLPLVVVQVVVVNVVLPLVVVQVDELHGAVVLVVVGRLVAVVIQELVVVVDIVLLLVLVLVFLVRPVVLVVVGRHVAHCQVLRLVKVDVVINILLVLVLVVLFPVLHDPVVLEVCGCLVAQPREVSRTRDAPGQGQRNELASAPDEPRRRRARPRAEQPPHRHTHFHVLDAQECR